MVVLEELGKFGEAIANFNFDDFKNVVIEFINKSIRDSKNSVNGMKTLLESGYDSAQVPNDIKRSEETINAYEQVLNNPELLDAFVKLKLTENIDTCIHNIYDARVNSKSNPKEEVSIRCMDGRSYFFSGEVKDKLINEDLEEIRRVLYETAGLQYTNSDEILAITDEKERDRLFNLNNIQIASDGRRELAPIRSVMIPFEPEKYLQNLLGRFNVTSHSFGAPNL